MLLAKGEPSISFHTFETLTYFGVADHALPDKGVSDLRIGGAAHKKPWIATVVACDRLTPFAPEA